MGIILVCTLVDICAYIEYTGHTCNTHDYIFSSVLNCVYFTAELDKLGKAIQELRKLDIQVVTEDFLDNAKEGGKVLELIKSTNIAPWGSDVSLQL